MHVLIEVVKTAQANSINPLPLPTTTLSIASVYSYCSLVHHHQKNQQQQHIFHLIAFAASPLTSQQSARLCQPHRHHAVVQTWALSVGLGAQASLSITCCCRGHHSASNSTSPVPASASSAAAAIHMQQQQQAACCVTRHQPQPGAVHE